MSKELRGHSITQKSFDEKHIKIGSVLLGKIQKKETEPHYKVILSTHNQKLRLASITTIPASGKIIKVEPVHFYNSNTIEGYICKKNMCTLEHKKAIELSENRKLVIKECFATESLMNQINELLEYIKKLEGENKQKTETIHQQQETIHKKQQESEQKDKEIEDEKFKGMIGWVVAGVVTVGATINHLLNNNDKNKNK